MLEHPGQVANISPLPLANPPESLRALLPYHCAYTGFLIVGTLLRVAAPSSNSKSPWRNPESPCVIEPHASMRPINKNADPISDSELIPRIIP